jgi:hypothetical protein
MDELKRLRDKIVAMEEQMFTLWHAPNMPGSIEYKKQFEKDLEAMNNFTRS